MSQQQAHNTKQPLLVIVTGLSGAGRSVAIKALEDVGFFCIDNLPIGLVGSAVDFIAKNEFEYYALGMDVRDANFAHKFDTIKASLADKARVDVIFLTADENIILSRYSATRRKHPLLDTGGDLIAAVRREKHFLQPIEKSADVCFDTTLWSPHYLSRMIEDRYKGNGLHRNLHVTISSFGFKYGQYQPADSVFDVRFLDNPYFVPDLRDKTGLEAAVRDYVFKDVRATEFLDHLVQLHQFLLPNYYKEGKHYFRIGIGCTGGKHRSVCFAESLAHKLTTLEIPNILISVNHRDINYLDLVKQNK